MKKSLIVSVVMILVLSLCMAAGAEGLFASELRPADSPGSFSPRSEFPFLVSSCRSLRWNFRPV